MLNVCGALDRPHPGVSKQLGTQVMRVEINGVGCLPSVSHYFCLRWWRMAGKIKCFIEQNNLLCLNMSPPRVSIYSSQSRSHYVITDADARKTAGTILYRHSIGIMNDLHPLWFYGALVDQ